MGIELVFVDCRDNLECQEGLPPVVTQTPPD